MTISIEPPRLSGAEVGDRVFWKHPGTARAYGHIAGIVADGQDFLVEVTPEGHEEVIRRFNPDVLTLAPRKYVVGDEVSLKDEDALPDGTTLTDIGRLPLFKSRGKWFVIEPNTPAPGVRKTRLFGIRTIAWLPAAYTND